MSGIKINY
jgi:hypothetical protein